MGVAVSSFHSSEEALSDDVKTIFDWCKEGNSNKIAELLTNQRLDINECDETVNLTIYINIYVRHWSMFRVAFRKSRFNNSVAVVHLILF